MTMLKKKKTPNWGDVQTLAILLGFRQHGWDPLTTVGREINALIKSVPDILDDVQLWFSTGDGGTKTNNNQLYAHY